MKKWLSKAVLSIGATLMLGSCMSTLPIENTDEETGIRGCKPSEVIGWNYLGASNIVKYYSKTKHKKYKKLYMDIYESGVYTEQVNELIDNHDYFFKKETEREDYKDAQKNWKFYSRYEKKEYIKGLYKRYICYNKEITEEEAPKKVTFKLNEPGDNRLGYYCETDNELAFFSNNDIFEKDFNEVFSTSIHELYHLDQFKGKRDGPQGELLDSQKADDVYFKIYNRDDVSDEYYRNSFFELPAYHAEKYFKTGKKLPKIKIFAKNKKYQRLFNMYEEKCEKYLDDGLITKKEARAMGFIFE